MEFSHITLFLFIVFSSLRIFSYLPQIYRVASDQNGASAIAYSTWAMWVGANVSTGLYAGVNLNDPFLALVSAIYATCCALVIALTIFKRRCHARRRGVAHPVAPPLSTNRATQMAIEALLLADAMRAGSGQAMARRQG